MSLAVRRAAPLAAALVCALAAPAARAADPGPEVLRAQIAEVTATATPRLQSRIAQVTATPSPRGRTRVAQATPTPGAEPPISGSPPVPLATATPAATASPTPTPAAASATGGGLPQTGSETVVVALLGLSLLSLGAGLRLATADGARG